MKQVKCVITDDEPTACEGLQRYVEKVDFLSLMGVCEDTMQLNTLLQTEQPDLLFLDIEMPKINGIDVCKKIREFSSDSLVVFISNKEELVFQTFEVQPFRFIRKEAFENTVTSLVVSILNKWLQNKGRLLQLQENGSNDLYSFSIPHILYIEAQRKDCLIVTTEGTCVFRCRLMELEEKLADCHFIKIHRSYLVNCMHIFRIGKSFVQLTNGTELPISRGKTEEIKQLFLQYNTTY